MIRAEEAREKSLKKLREIVTEQMEKVEALINEACDDGEFIIVLEENLKPQVIEELKELGYTVMEDNGETLIDWDEILEDEDENEEELKEEEPEDAENPEEKEEDTEEAKIAEENQADDVNDCKDESEEATTGEGDEVVETLFDDEEKEAKVEEEQIDEKTEVPAAGDEISTESNEGNDNNF